MLSDGSSGRTPGNLGRAGSSALSRPGSTTLGRAGSAQPLVRRGSSSSLPLKRREHVKQRPQGKQGRPVLVFFVLLIVAFVLITGHRLFLGGKGNEISQAHRKHLRVESDNLRVQLGNPKEKALQSQEEDPEAKAELQAAAEKFKKQKEDNGHALNIGANTNTDNQLSDIHSDSDSAPETSPSPNPPDLDLLNTRSENSSSLRSVIKQLPPEDFSAAGLEKKRQAVKAAAIHSWKAYEEHAWGFDELQPVTQDGKQTLGGLGATIVDSLTTLWLMDLKEEFARARGWVATALECNSTQKISLFETNIRVVGGLLGAFDLSGDQVFLDKAVQCVDLMLPVFDTSPTGGALLLFSMHCKMVCYCVGVNLTVASRTCIDAKSRSGQSPARSTNR